MAAAGDAVQAHELQTPKTIFRQNCRKPRAMTGWRFFRLSRGFSHCSEPPAARQSLPLRQLLPGCLCNAAAGPREKISKKRSGNIGPPFAMGFAGSSSGSLRVRASATSRLAPPAGFHAARADSNTPKTDEASPFALLVGAAAPPAQKPSNTPGNASGGKSDEKPDDGKSLRSGQRRADPQTYSETGRGSRQQQPGFVFSRPTTAIRTTRPRPIRMQRRPRIPASRFEHGAAASGRRRQSACFRCQRRRRV